MPENNNIKFIVRSMQVSDCLEVEQIWNMVQFLETKYNNEIYLKVDPGGIFVAQDIKSGKLLGVCSGVNLSPNLAFVGQFAVLPGYQGLGIGSSLWEAIMGHIGTQRNISLYSAEQMLPKYRDRSHFVVVPKKRGLSFKGKADCSQLIKTIEGISVVPISDNNIQKVIQYDREVCEGLDRTAFIEQISKIKEFVNGVALNQNNQVLGYCLLTLSNYETAIIEPLYANDEKIAELLVGKCCKSLAITQTSGVSYPCWDSNTKSIAIAKKMGLDLKNSFPILFTKKQIDGNLEKIFCTSSRCFFPF